MYLPRLLRDQGLLEAISDGTTHLMWQEETFAYAEGLDEKTGRHLGLKAEDPCLAKLSGLLVKSAAADFQMIQDKLQEQGNGTVVPVIPGTHVPPTQQGIFDKPVEKVQRNI